MLLSCRRKKNKYIGVSDGQPGRAGMFAQPQCSVSWTAFQSHSLSPTPDVPEEDANEHILMLQNCQILSKESNNAIEMSKSTPGWACQGRQQPHSL